MSSLASSREMLAQAERDRRARESARTRAAATTASPPPAAASGAPRSASSSSTRASSPPPLSASAAAAAVATSPRGGCFGLRRPVPPAPQSDAEYARTLQNLEAAAASASRRAPADNVTQDPSLVGKLYLDDPVWGRWVHAGPPGSRPGCLASCGLSCCHCLMPPLCTDNRKAARARVFRTLTFWMSIAQIALVVVSLSFRGFAPYEVNFGLGPWMDTLDFLGAKNAAKIVRKGEAWRLLVPIFLHNGLLHVFTNLLMQVRLGIQAELFWGMRRFLPLYFGAGVMGSLLSTVLLPNAVSVGASGALCGVLGAWTTFLAMHWGHGSEAEQAARVRDMISTVINVVILFATSFIPNIDWAAHLGGLIGGVLLALWYFGPALGGEPFAYNALSPSEAQRIVAANLRALREGVGALPALPSRIGRGVSPTRQTASPQNTVPLMTSARGGGGGRRLDGRETDAGGGGGGAEREPCCTRVGVAVDVANDVVCAPMSLIVLGCGRDAPRALCRGAAVSLCGLFTYIVFVCACFGVIYGGVITTDASLLDVCALIQAAYPTYALRCPY